MIIEMAMEVEHNKGIQDSEKEATKWWRVSDWKLERKKANVEGKQKDC